MDNNDKLIQFFTASGLVSRATAAEISEVFQHKELDAHQYQLKAGQICNEYLFLEEGFMRSYATDVDGEEVTTGFYGPANVVFEVSSFFTRSLSQEYIQAAVPCKGWYISYEQLNKLFHDLPEFREFGRSILVKGYTALKSRMLDTITQTAEQRYIQLLNSKPEVLQQASLKHIASYLGITDSSLSRIRKEYSSR